MRTVYLFMAHAVLNERANHCRRSALLEVTLLHKRERVYNTGYKRDFREHLAETYCLDFREIVYIHYIQQRPGWRCDKSRRARPGASRTHATNAAACVRFEHLARYARAVCNHARYKVPLR